MAMDLLQLQFGNYAQCDDTVFESRLTPADLTVEKANFCADCSLPMVLADGEYQCHLCGQVQPYCEVHQEHEIVNASIRVSTGANKGRFYNISNDYTRTQMKIIMDQLSQNLTNYTGKAFPMNILTAAATQYNRIQKHVAEDDIDATGRVRGQKKFVRRGNIKDEVLAALIYFEGVREKIVRKKRDIAEFMKLPTCGFSRGENILRDLHAEDKIDVPVDEEPIEGYVDRYMDALDLDNPSYTQFVVDVVNLSEKRRIGMDSQLSSKIVGTIWVLITKCRLGIPPTTLERAADNTKRNTFNKFSVIIYDNMRVFEPIFIRYSIPRS